MLSHETASAGHVHWPAATTPQNASYDPIAGVRWSVEGWVALGTGAPAHVALTDVDAQIASRPDDAALHAQRAVVLRVLQRFEEATRELAGAIARDAHVTDDPDVALTDAYLAARAGRFDDAVRSARHAMPRLDGSEDLREQLVLEVARWSMARGPDGVDDAIALLREMTGPGASAAVARATLSLALHRRGRVDEAREVARSAELPSPYASTMPRPGALVDGEIDAAVGTAYLLAGRGPEAVTFLERALGHVTRVWRTSIEASLAEARRTPGHAATARTTLPASRPGRVP
ncbi:MAG: tetratricopeptide repeat protein [Deltaproteobacteria bacterium]